MVVFVIPSEILLDPCGGIFSRPLSASRASSFFFRRRFHIAVCVQRMDTVITVGTWESERVKEPAIVHSTQLMPAGVSLRTVVGDGLCFRCRSVRLSVHLSDEEKGEYEGVPKPNVVRK
jgi:hypothetical protein